MINHVFSPDEMWTEVGISTVDQSAPYYRTDGYWNGAVWFPHQWMVWKALLDLGEGEKAYQVATTALNTWEKNVRRVITPSNTSLSPHNVEPDGINSPVYHLLYSTGFAAYYRIGKVSTGFEVWISNSHFNDDYTQYQAEIALMIQQFLISEQFLFA